VKLSGKFGRGPELAFFNYDGPWAIFQFFGDADRWTSNGSLHTLEWVLRRVTSTRPELVLVSKLAVAPHFAQQHSWNLSDDRHAEIRRG
jgi:hypothetical protein